MDESTVQAGSKSSLDTNDTISQIFDKIIKRILQGGVSKAAVVDFINGLYGENLPRDNELTYIATEGVDGRLKKTLADIIISVRDGECVRRFHLEAQTDADHIIVIRVFEYGFRDALLHQYTKGNKITLPFPNPAIIFLEHTESTPDELILELDFGKQGKAEYTVPAIKFLNYSVEELCEKKMTILLPLYLLKLRRDVENAKRRKHGREDILREKARELKTLVSDKLLPAIITSEAAGDITNNDAFELLQLIERLYNYLYGGIVEFKDEEANTMSALAEIIELKYDKRYERDMAEGKKAIAEEVTKQVTKQVTKEVTKEVTKKVTEQVAKQTAKQTAYKIAHGLKQMGISIDVIMQTTGLSSEEISQL